ncbi:MAG: alkaline phosphatase family protein [Myxococcota bacterium]|nr:alkaline phosphatase family protein [Myxococcota bacterium]
MTGARSLILGFDGATWAVADPLIEAGKMPNLNRLRQKGIWAPLNSTTPPMTLPSWSSMLTGCNPGKHGIFDFVRLDGNRLRFVNSTDRLRPTLHQILSERGARVVSMAVPTTWPPQPINGMVISGFDSPVSTGIDGSFCYPASLYKELQKRFGGLRFADFQESNIGSGWHRDALSKLLKEIDRKTRITEWIMSQERWDCLMLLFGESDTVSHHFWMFHDPESPRFHYDKELHKAIEKVYCRLDEALGRLLDKANPDWTCICSDHGFGGAGLHVLYLNSYLEQKGWLKTRERGRSRLEPLRLWAAKNVPPSILERAFRKIPSAVRDRLESRARYGGISLGASEAFSDEMNYAATIRMNNTQRFAELKKDLLDWQVDGAHPVRAVHLREELYWGEGVIFSPEVIVELNEREGYSYTLLASSRSRGSSWSVLPPESYMGGKGLGMNGTHRQHGVLVMHGRGISAHGEVEANMMDIAPSLFHAMGESIPLDMDGQILPGVQDAKPPRYTEHKIDLQTHHRASAKESMAIRNRLEKLGYL